ncbi:hypothetical protein PHYBOEH_007234 [Phytophthora boehmeriae]|uniref:Uncharacterized protein n=1 Tax=Phytophthora boehmeriae TaxID=109152 RepID=A0A8T1WC41_9STRA|nr:hypothetical protein PHYBOEH_007234 [Phytophthora boehmeriae]
MDASDSTAGWDVSHIPSLTGKVAVVTGANSGIGFITALELARKQAQVVLACRSVERGHQAVNAIKSELGDAIHSVEFMELDLSDLRSVQRFGETFVTKFERLDILVNNAGLLVPLQTHTAEGLEMQFAVNHLGHFYLTSLLFELLKRGDEPSRVVTVSSLSHSWVKLNLSKLARSRPDKSTYSKEYATSKLANLLFTYELNRRITAAGLAGKVLAVAAHPGIASSEIPLKVLAGHFPSWMQSFVRKLFEISHLGQPIERGALPSLFAATGVSVKSGDYFGPDGFLGIRGKCPKKIESSRASHSEEDGAALWALSEDVAKCKFEVKK